MCCEGVVALPQNFLPMAQRLRSVTCRFANYVWSDRLPATNPQENTIMAKRNRLHFHDWNGAKVIDLGDMEIWDGADLALLRETLTKLIDKERVHSVGVNMAYVKYIPSGFFGLLFDWREKGIRVQLFNPQAHVQRMLWFQQFMEPIGKSAFLLLSEPKQPYLAGSTPSWATTRPEATPDTDDDNDDTSLTAFDSADDEDDLVFANVGDDEESFED